MRKRKIYKLCAKAPKCTPKFGYNVNISLGKSNTKKKEKKKDWTQFSEKKKWKRWISFVSPWIAWSENDTSSVWSIKWFTSAAAAAAAALLGNDWHSHMQKESPKCMVRVGVVISQKWAVNFRYFAQKDAEHSIDKLFDVVCLCFIFFFFCYFISFFFIFSSTFHRKRMNAVLACHFQNCAYLDHILNLT